MDNPWVIWSFEHHAWWRPNRHGYGGSILVAGLYSESEAREIERRANYGGKKHEKAMPLKAGFEFEFDRHGTATAPSVFQTVFGTLFE